LSFLRTHYLALVAFLIIIVSFGELVTPLKAVLGITIGTGVGAIMHLVFTDEELQDWAWRLPFLAGILLGAVAICT
jgi:MFS family permease